MANIVSSVGGRGTFRFIDDSGGILFAVRAIISNFPVIEADFSDRRNPRWYTFGHLSISYKTETIFWETWLNYPDQVFLVDKEWQTFQDFGTLQVDLPEQLYDPGGTDISLDLNWQMRGNALLTVYIAS